MSTFCLDNRSDPESVARAKKALRRMIRLGKRAEKIMERIETVGHFDGRMPLVFFGRKTYGNHDGYDVSIHRFPAYRSISRDDVPGWNDITVECGEREEGSYGGSKFWTMPVYLKGSALVEEIDDKYARTGRVNVMNLKATLKSARLGECRLKSNGTVTFDTDRAFSYGINVFRIRRNPDASDKAREEATLFAKAVARSLIRHEENTGSYYRESNTKTPQKLLDLQATIPRWLLEDGFVKRMFNDMLDAIEVVKVMEI